MRIDIELALKQGIINQDQAQQLKKLAVPEAATSTEPDRSDFASIDDEPIGLIKGYNDIFLTLAILLLGFGVYQISPEAIANYLIAATGWISAEILRVKYRSVLPMIVSSMMILFLVGEVPWAIWDNDPQLINWVLIGHLGLCLAVVLISYWRFKLPFTLALISLTSVLLIFYLILIGLNSLGIDLTDDTLYVTLQAYSFIAGIVTFFLAMRYDMSDPLRQTRRSDCAFWLHVSASALLIHGALGQVFMDDANLQPVLFLACVAVIYLVSLIINRKSPIVASLIYVLSAVYHLLETYGMEGLDTTASTALLLGLIMFFSSIFWNNLRAILLSPWKETRFVKRLSPLDRAY